MRYHPSAWQLNPVQKLGFWLSIACLFLMHSRIFDVHFKELHIPILTYWGSIAIAIITGGFARAFFNRVGFILLVFTGWLGLASLAGEWIRGSVDLLTEMWLKAVLMYMIVAGLLLTYDHFRGAMQAMAFSIIALAVTALLFGDTSTGRLLLPYGKFANPNDLAQILLMGFPFCWFVATNGRFSRPRRLAVMAGVPLLFVALAKTGSRGALLALGVILLTMFFHVSLKKKIGMAVSGLIVAALAIAMVPERIRDRYLTFFEGTDYGTHVETIRLRSIQIEESATTSAQARRELLKRSLKLTFEHPVLGVGPGMFALGDHLRSEEQNRRSIWQVTHNTFTQVSSESGLPGLFLYIGLLVLCWKATARSPASRRRGDPIEAELAAASFSLRLSLISYMAAAQFASLAYNSQLATLAGLAVVFARTAHFAAPAEQPAEKAQALTAPAFALAGLRRR